MKIFLCLLIYSFCLPTANASEPIEVTVLGDRVNLRNSNTTESDVVGQADYGEKLQAISFEESWVEVLPPDGFAAWVFSPLLFEDREVRAPELNVRSGPGTQFIILGELKRGDPVTVLESLEEWRKIEAPESVTLWISRNFVQVPPSVEIPVVVPEVEPTPIPTVMPIPIPTPITIIKVKTIEKIVEVQVTPTPMPKVEAPEGLNLVPLRGQGTLSKRKGYLRAYLLAGSSPSRFVLTRSFQGRSDQTICYLIGDEDLLKEAAGENVIISGYDFWVTGQKLPVTKVETISIAPESP
jgi:SH3-like domain-containing protein